MAQYGDIVGDLGAVQMNALKASTNTNWKGFYRIVDAKLMGFTTGWQFVGPSTNKDRFGGTFEEAVAKGRLAEPSYWEFYAPDLDKVVAQKR